MTDDGVLVTDETGSRLVFTRSLPHRRSVVWQALVDPVQRAAWLFPGTLEARVGGRVDLEHEPEGIVGEVIEVQEECVLALTWDSPEGRGSVVRFELSDERGGTRLVLTQLLGERGRPGGLLAGWHHTLDRLRAHLGGERVRQDVRRSTELCDHYAGIVTSSHPTRRSPPAPRR